MQVEILVWLSAGIGLGLFIAMAVLAIFAASERRVLRRKRAGVPVAAPLPAAEPEPAPEPSAAEVEAAPARDVEQTPAPVAAADRQQPDIEGLFEKAFQTSLGQEAEAGDPPERKDA